MVKEKCTNSIFLHPDNAVLTNRKVEVITVLGSCIAITMYNSKIKAGSISHSSLPYCPDLGLNLNLNSALIYKYVDSSIHKMIEWFRSKDSKLPDLEVKVFGGANYFVESSGEESVFNIGKRNIEAAFNILSDFSITPKAVDTGGRVSRKLIFNACDGIVLLKRISQFGNDNEN